MRIQYVNDLHMECGHTPELHRVAGAEVLTVAGDLINWKQRERGEEWLLNEARHFEKVYYVLGNHEYYGANNFDEVELWWIKREGKWPRNVHFLALGLFDIFRNVMFTGETLWTQTTPAEEYMFPFVMNDAAACPGLNAQRLNLVNKRAREAIETNVQLGQNMGYKTFVLTHHLPTEAITAPQWKGDKWNCFFANKPGWAEELDADFWHFGHTHDTIDAVHCGTRYVCNPYGYHGYATNREYDNTKVIDV